MGRRRPGNADAAHKARQVPKAASAAALVKASPRWRAVGATAIASTALPLLGGASPPPRGAQLRALIKNLVPVAYPRVRAVGGANYGRAARSHP